MVKLAAAFLASYFFFSWTTFVFSLLSSFSDDPLGWGIRASLGLFLISFLAVRFLGKVLRRSTSEERPIFSHLRGGRLRDHLAGVLFLIFSFWLMTKSFSYRDLHFQIASNIFDDFNIHLGIIRSFSWGKNFPPELPFFAGQPLRYHFLTDFSFAVLEYLGLRIDWAVNLPSALAFTSLLVLIYLLGKRVFKSALVGFISVLLFLFNGTLTFVKFFQKYGLSWSTPKQIWQIGKYLSAGPFDQGIISIFWNLNTFVNQRHLIFAAGLFLLVIYLLLEAKKRDDIVLLLSAGILAGLMPFWHGLVFLATLVVGTLLVGRKRFSFFLFPALILALPQLIFLFGKASRLPLLKIGFLVAESFSLINFVKYWGLNLGFSLFTIPAGLWAANKKQRQFCWPFLSLWLMANLFQFTPNMFHNHSLLNLWIIIFNFYSAFFLVWLLKKGWRAKILAGVLFFLLIFSGVLDLMVIKNDFIHRIADYPKDKLTTWMVQNTATDEVFLVPPDSMYNPANLAGRKVFLGASHFVWGYGYDINPRKILTNRIYGGDNREEIINLVKKTGVDYWLTTDKGLTLAKVYEDEKWALYSF